MISMKNLLFSSLLPLIFTLLCLIGCAGKHGKLMESALASYRVNDYEAALREAVMALKYKPDYEEAQNFAPTFFDAAVENRQDRIRSLASSSRRFKWDGIVAEYEALIEINSLVRSLPPLRHEKTLQRITFNTKDYTHHLNEALEKAAEAHYQEGIQIANSSDDAETQKRAAKEFKKADTFVPGYKDARTRYQQTRSAGIKRIAILTFEDKSRKRYAYGAVAETITDNIISSVLNNPVATEFLTIVSRDRLEQVLAEQDLSRTRWLDRKTAASIGNVLGIHEIVVGQITQIIYTPPQIEETRFDRRARVKKRTGTETYVDKKGRTKKRPKYSEVRISARVVHYQLLSSVSIIGSYKILDAQTAELKKADNFTTTHEFKAEWGRFTGDKDALSSRDLALVLHDEARPPIEEVMVLEAANELSKKLAEALKAYVR